MSGQVGVAIVGASGYAARELIRILLNHPRVRITVATSRQDEAPRLDALHPSLTRRIDLACEPFDADRIAERASFAFLGAAAHGEPGRRSGPPPSAASGSST